MPSRVKQGETLICFENMCPLEHISVEEIIDASLMAYKIINEYICIT